jgi:hypothetical protein
MYFGLTVQKLRRMANSSQVLTMLFKYNTNAHKQIINQTKHLTIIQTYYWEECLLINFLVVGQYSVETFGLATQCNVSRPTGKLLRKYRITVEVTFGEDDHSREQADFSARLLILSIVLSILASHKLGWVQLGSSYGCDFD